MTFVRCTLCDKDTTSYAVDNTNFVCSVCLHIHIED